MPGAIDAAEASGIVITSPVAVAASRRLAAIRPAPFPASRPSTMQTAEGSRARSGSASSTRLTALACQPRLQSHWAVWDATRRSSSTTSTRPGLAGRSIGAVGRIMVASWGGKVLTRKVSTSSLGRNPATAKSPQGDNPAQMSPSCRQNRHRPHTPIGRSCQSLGPDGRSCSVCRLSPRATASAIRSAAGPSRISRLSKSDSGS